MAGIRQTSYNYTRVDVPGSPPAVQVLGPNPKRVGIVLSSVAFNSYGVTFNQNLDFFGNAEVCMLKDSSSQFVMCCCDWGTILQMPLYGLGDDGMQFGIVEILSDNPEEWYYERATRRQQ